MRVVLDTNVLISALLAAGAPPAQLIVRWRQGGFDLLTAAPQLDELARVTRHPKLRTRRKAALVGRVINKLRSLAVMVDMLPPVAASPDPYDSYVLSIAAGGQADFLVAGDKADLLALGIHTGTKIVSVGNFIALSRFSS
jgi:putative PIN family toxin of toxin-antitoxin system